MMSYAIWFSSTKNRVENRIRIESRMTATDILATTAVALSLAAVLGLTITLPLLFQKGTNLKYDLAEGINEFKLMTEDTWQRIVTVKTGKGPRVARLSQEQCRCYERESHKATSIQQSMTDLVI